MEKIIEESLKVKGKKLKLKRKTQKFSVLHYGF